MKFCKECGPATNLVRNDTQIVAHQQSLFTCYFRCCDENDLSKGAALKIPDRRMKTGMFDLFGKKIRQVSNSKISRITFSVRVASQPFDKKKDTNMFRD